MAGDLRAAAKIYGRLLDQGGNADQRVLLGRAVAVDEEKPSEAIRLAKLAISLDPSTPLADTASALITKHNTTHARPHHLMAGICINCFIVSEVAPRRWPISVG